MYPGAVLYVPRGLGTKPPARSKQLLLAQYTTLSDTLLCIIFEHPGQCMVYYMNGDSGDCI